MTDTEVVEPEEEVLKAANENEERDPERLKPKLGMPLFDMKAAAAGAKNPLRLRYVPFAPSPKQAYFLGTTCPELFFGGAGGGGKSVALLAGALQFCDVPGYSALILRRRLTDLTQPNALISMSEEWLDQVPAASFNKNERKWTFNTGPGNRPAVIQFGYLNHLQDIGRYRGAEYHYIAWDELGEFPSDFPYKFLFSRVRRPKGLSREDVIRRFGQAPDGMTILDICLRIRAASNPGGPGMAWVKKRLVDLETRLAPFLPATFNDNPAIDPEEYKAMLALLPEVERRRMELGDWTIQEIPGALWTLEVATKYRSSWTEDEGVEMFDRVYVGVDPSVGGGAEGMDECGIVAAGITGQGRVTVLVDGSILAAPDVWAQRAVSLHHRLRGSGIVIEKNQGHELLRTQIRDAADQLGVPQPTVLLANARGTKESRAGTIVGAYKNPQGAPTVVHSSDPSIIGGELEAQMVGWIPGRKTGRKTDGVQSPDRVDALVWVLRGLLYPSEIDDFNQSFDSGSVVDLMRGWRR